MASLGLFQVFGHLFLFVSELSVQYARRGLEQQFILFVAVLGLCCCTRAFSSCSEQGLLLAGVHRLSPVVASRVVEHGLQARGPQ